ncbi:sugar-binding transcriptional regulator [Clostridium tarantellae]|uniref:Sugar-binding transcriptional regulator n=1 Tax=Clostridium tarantellae TaxID=39493 RepID=A0A6I1MKQ5_9CLOT|nr:sugar-binding transcriptional regulator [Clostridium tarantellae]
MQEILKLQKIIVPEIVDLLEKRYSILRTIYYNQPIGRRILANQLNLGERIVRTEISFLKEQNLIQISTPGMSVTPEGENILEALKSFIHEIKGLSNMEDKIKRLLKLKDVVIVPGNIDEEEGVGKELGKATANYVKNIIKDNDIVAITGGSTVKEVVDNFPKMPHINNVLVVPARGGMGKKVETQANTLAAQLAKKVNGNYKMLHVPANVSEEIIDTLIKQQDIKEIIDNVKNANILIYGIGQAEKMAQKRGVPKEVIDKLLQLGAVGEAFGCYFNKNSEVVSIMQTLGININDIKKIETHIAVAGGKSKVDAIMATICNNKNGVLVTDESAAKEILKKLNESE